MNNANNTHIVCYGYNNRNAIFAYSFFAFPFFFNKIIPSWVYLQDNNHVKEM